MNETVQLTFLHTSPVHVATFDDLLSSHSQHVVADHLVHENLLDDAIKHGLTPEIEQSVAYLIQHAFANGADALICTCSTLGSIAERVGGAGLVMRIDRPMAEFAVENGRRISVVAALRSTIHPTTDLLKAVAAEKGKEIDLSMHICPTAWPYFEAGDHAQFWAEIEKTLREVAADADILILAQVSMAGAATLCADLTVPILTSPKMGLDAVLQQLSKDK